MTKKWQENRFILCVCVWGGGLIRRLKMLCDGYKAWIQWACGVGDNGSVHTHRRALAGEVAHTASPLIDFFPQRPQPLVAARSCDTTKSQLLLLLLLLLWCFDGAEQTIVTLVVGVWRRLSVARRRHSNWSISFFNKINTILVARKVTTNSQNTCHFLNCTRNYIVNSFTKYLVMRTFHLHPC